MQKRGGHRGGRGGHGHRDDDPIVKISKNLSYLLRHGAEKEGLHIDKHGYVLLNEILAMKFYKTKKVTEKEIREVVEQNDKKRFELKTEADESGKPALYIRASQGHSIKTIEDEGLLKKVENPTEIPICLHGTNKKAWDSIKTEGLKPMTRNHVHFAGGFPGENGVISGMRQSCTVFIELDVEKAMKDGMEFLVSENKVILSRGINGMITPEYFKKVTIRDTGNVKEVDPKEFQGKGGKRGSKTLEERKEEDPVPGNQDQDQDKSANKKGGNQVTE